MKEACKVIPVPQIVSFSLKESKTHLFTRRLQSLEKVLVQNIQFGLSPSLTEAIRSIPRWKFVQCALPHVMLCAAQLISERFAARETATRSIILTLSPT